MVSASVRRRKLLLTWNALYGHFTNDNDIVESEEVPENTVRFRVTYNAEAVEPFVDEYESGQSVRLSWFYIADDFRNFMECKNIFLEGIRKKRVYIFFTPQALKNWK